VKRKNGVPWTAPWQAAPSPLNGSAVQPDAIGARTSAETVVPAGALSFTKRSGVTKCPVTAFPPRCQVTYGVLAENVMSAREPLAIG
jgi:hypothetical protein